jgi:hypothetical protein
MALSVMRILQQQATGSQGSSFRGKSKKTSVDPTSAEPAAELEEKDEEAKSEEAPQGRGRQLCKAGKRKQRLVMAVVHQPSSEIFELATHLLLLSKGTSATSASSSPTALERRSMA